MNEPNGGEVDADHAFAYLGFEASLYLEKGASGMFAGRAEIRQGGAHRCRMVLAGQLDRDAAIAALEGKCREWIALQQGVEPAIDERGDES